MADIPKQSPWRTPLEEEMGLLQKGEEDGRRLKMTQRPDGSVLLDMERLSRLVEPSINGSTAPAPKTLSRKFSQRADRKAATVPDGDNLPISANAAVNSGGGRGGAAPPSPAAPSQPAASAPDKFVAVVLPPAAPTEATAATASPRQAAPCRRVHGRRAAAAASSPWFDPRRVLLFFATLSSMGTIILLYFTISMGKMADGDANAR